MIEVARTFVAWWWSFVPANALHVVVLGLLMLAVDRLLPRRVWPEVRYALWWLVMLRLAVPPSVASPIGIGHRWVGHAAPFDPALAASSTLVGVAYAVFAIWLIGAVAMTLLLGHRYRQLTSRWRRDSTAEVPAPLATAVAAAASRLCLRRPPRVRVIGPRRGPFVMGLRRPTLYVPRDLPAHHAEHVLLHELGHLKRGDHWLAAMGLALQVTYWFHPVAWLAQGRLAALREQCCDRTAARVLGGKTAGYRRTLLAFLAHSLDQADQVGLGFAHRRNALVERLRQLESDVVEPPWARRATVALVWVALGLVALPAARAGERAAVVVADVIERPPGCFALRYLVLQRLAAARAETDEHPALVDGTPHSLSPSPVADSAPDLHSRTEEDRSDASNPAVVLPPIRW